MLALHVYTCTISIYFSFTKPQMYAFDFLSSGIPKISQDVTKASHSFELKLFTLT